MLYTCGTFDICYINVELWIFVIYVELFTYTCRTFDMLNTQVTFDLYYIIVFEVPMWPKRIYMN